ncbi:ISAs1 family transposase [Streptomyces sp. NPDC056721]|uniref:ISAs1 family transposase n=1 Tax=Streptomyces sp. NPDC056721 TaxID=3345923 RepID=UPI0036B84ADA
MIRRLLQALDPDLLTAAIGDWLNGRGTTTEEPATRQAIAVDGNTLRDSRSSGNTARHVLAACDQDTSVVLASTDVDGKTNEITRFKPLLDQISDLRGTVITVGALHCQRDHVTYLAERGADWTLTVKGNQPTLHQQVAALPWRAVPDATRDTDRGHGRREILVAEPALPTLHPPAHGTRQDSHTYPDHPPSPTLPKKHGPSPSKRRRRPAHKPSHPTSDTQRSDSQEDGRGVSAGGPSCAS